MSSPQGAEVGRVSIRVLPDLDQFREKVKAYAESIDDVTVQVDADLTKFRNSVRVAREAAEANAANIKVNFDPDITSLQAAIAAANLQSVDIKMSIDLQGAPLVFAELSAIDQLVDRLDGRNIRLRVDVDGLAEAIAQLGALNGIADSSNRLGGSLNTANTAGQGLGRTALLVVGAFGALLALAGPLVAAGAAITAAWGAIATAISGIAPAMFLLAGIAAPIALGMDGIKKGFEGLEPVLTKLKQRVSDTFEEGIERIIPDLKTILLELDDEIIHIADSLTIAGLIMAQTFAQPGNLIQFEQVLRRVKDAAILLAQPIADIFVTLSTVADREPAFDLLVDPIENFAAKFTSSVARIGAEGGILDQALEGLSETVMSLSDGFVYLVENGITLFAKAAPGVNKFLDSLTGFFNRFDWERLGASVGNVFAGMGETLDQVPPETIERITASFEKLGATFKDPNVQAGFAKLLDWVPGFLSELDTLIQGFSTLILKLDETKVAIEQFVNDANTLADSINEKLPQGVKDAFAGFDQAVDEAVRKGLGLTPEEYGQKFGDPLYAGLFKAADRASEAAEPAFAVVDGKLRDVVTGQEVILTAGMDQLTIQMANRAKFLAQAMIPEPTGFVAGLGGLFAQGNAVVETSTGTLANTAATGATGINNSFQTGIAPLPGQTSETLAPLGTAADAPMGALNNNLTQAWGTAATTTQTGSTNVGTEAGKTGPNITNATSDLNTGLLAAAGRAVMQGFEDAARAAWAPIESWLAGLAARIRNIKGPVPKDRKILVPAGRAIMEGFESSLRTGFLGVESFLGSVAPEIERTFTGMDTSFADTMASNMNPENTFSPDLSATYSAAVQGEGVAHQIAMAMAGWQVVIDENGIAKMVNKSNTRRRAR